MKNALSAGVCNPLLVASIVFVAVVAVALPAQRAWERDVLVTMDQDTVIEYYRTEAGIARHLKNLEAAYRADTYGSTTPEGTLDLLVRAIEKEDIDLATKYFLIEDQSEVGADLIEAKNYSTLELFVDDMKRARVNGFSLDDSRYRFSTYDEDGVQEFIFDLYLNPVTGIWKLERF